MVKVTQYELKDGAIPFEVWFLSLSAKAALKVRSAIARMELGNFGDRKSVGGGVWERRIDFEQGYRIYFAKDGNDLVLLLFGGTKKRQQSDIDQAKGYWLEYKARKKLALKKLKSKDHKSPKKKRK